MGVGAWLRVWHGIGGSGIKGYLCGGMKAGEVWACVRV